jgi:hypothetical protein
MIDDIEELEAQIPHIFADFAQMKTYAEDPFILDRGDGIYVYDVHGTQYIDTLAGTASVSVGHHNPVIIEAMTKQLDKMTFASPNSSVNSASLRLVKLLLSIVPQNISAVKFYSGGSEANEGMLKAARQFWYQSGQPQKQKIIGRYGEGVGGTLACKAVGGMPAKFGPTPAGFVQVHPGNAAGGCSMCRPRGGACHLTCVRSWRTRFARKAGDGRRRDRRTDWAIDLATQGLLALRPRDLRSLRHSVAVRRDRDRAGPVGRVVGRRLRRGVSGHDGHRQGHEWRLRSALRAAVERASGVGILGR